MTSKLGILFNHTVSITEVISRHINVKIISNVKMCQLFRHSCEETEMIYEITQHSWQPTTDWKRRALAPPPLPGKQLWNGATTQYALWQAGWRCD